MTSLAIKPLVLIDKRSPPLGRAYVEIIEDGRFKVGRCEEASLIYNSAAEAYAWYRPLANDGDSGAWNICYHLEDHMNEEAS